MHLVKIEINGAVSAFNRLPFLDIDDKVLPQSTAINRYLAKQFG